MADQGKKSSGGFLGFGRKKSGDDVDVSKPAQASPEEVEAVNRAEASADKIQLYIKRVGFGNMVFFAGDKPEGNEAYFVEVGKKMVGWDITLWRGGQDKTGTPILHLRKAVTFLGLLGWDKGSKMTVDQHQGGQGGAGLDQRPGNNTGSDGFGDDPEGTNAPAELNPSFSGPGVKDEQLALTADDRKQLKNDLTESMKALNVANPEEAQPLAIMQRKHAFRSNRNTFEYNGMTYAWDFKIIVGATHTLTNLDTNEIVAICSLKAKVQAQAITAWGLRQNGCLEIMGSGRLMQDMIVATLIGMLEWRKHNNKVWFVFLAAA